MMQYQQLWIDYKLKFTHKQSNAKSSHKSTLKKKYSNKTIRQTWNPKMQSTLSIFSFKCNKCYSQHNGENMHKQKNRGNHTHMLAHTDKMLCGGQKNNPFPGSDFLKIS
jgi:1,2-phenylacetyl-CoA epoxidase catalytic subunit